ncbi:MAG TPA: hypothetical protein VKF38_14750 [Anaerolineaceae bacterium]|nr:hypothetical protein [Anaerolineaceae bacterium]
MGNIETSATPIKSRKLSLRNINEDIWVLLYCLGLSICSGILLIIQNYDYLPDWFPGPDHFIVRNLQFYLPCLFFFAGCIFFYFMMIGLKPFIIPALDGFKELQFWQKFRIALGAGFVLISILPWFFRDQINQYLLNYTLQRYDQVINGIEKYKLDTGVYPRKLEKLIPGYLPTYPGYYMKFIDDVIYNRSSHECYYYREPYSFCFSSRVLFGEKEFQFCPIDELICKNIQTTDYSDGNIERINQRWIMITYPD